MAEWSLLEHDWPPERAFDPYSYGLNNCYQEKPPLEPCFTPQAHQYLPPTPPTPPSTPTLKLLLSPPTPRAPMHKDYTPVPKRDNPREIRNKAEKQRRDKLNHSIAQLASIVPPVLAANRKIDKTGVLRLTAHYLRSHQYVFGDSIGQPTHRQDLNEASAQAVLGLLNGFLLTTTYRGIVVVVSQNVHQYLGYSELDLLGQNMFSLTHPDDLQILKQQLLPKIHLLGQNGELLVPDEPEGKQKLNSLLANDKRQFIIRFKKLGQRSEPAQYVTCYVEGTMRKSDRACRGYNRCCQMVRRARARGDNPCSSGNDVVFVGLVRPTSETFITERNLESFKMEYRTRHSIDGEIIQCEQRIAIVTGYMTHEVHGVNAMNFMHRDDVRWVIIALREMYDQHRIVGESCYRLMTKNGQFIYMRTRGRLDVEDDTRAVRSFVCTNTVVEEQEGKQLIKLMKKKFMLMVNNSEDPPPDEDVKEVTDNQTVAVEDPRNLEKVILHLVTNLPSPQSEDCRSATSDNGESPSLPLAIIPPRRERIVRAIEKIYSVIKTFNKDLDIVNVRQQEQHEEYLFENKTLSTSNDNVQLETSVVSLTSSTHMFRYDINQISHENFKQFGNVYEQQSDIGLGDPSTSSTYTGLPTLYERDNNSSSIPLIHNINQPCKEINANNNIITPHPQLNSPQISVQLGELHSIVQAATSQGPIGTKRPFDNLDQYDLSKKKTSSFMELQIIQNELNIRSNSSVLDDLHPALEEEVSVLDSTAVGTMENTIDIDFTNYLGGEENQHDNILENIEELEFEFPEGK